MLEPDDRRAGSSGASSMPGWLAATSSDPSPQRRRQPVRRRRLPAHRGRDRRCARTPAGRHQRAVRAAVTRSSASSAASRPMRAARAGDRSCWPASRTAPPPCAPRSRQGSRPCSQAPPPWPARRQTSRRAARDRRRHRSGHPGRRPGRGDRDGDGAARRARTVRRDVVRARGRRRRPGSADRLAPDAALAVSIVTAQGRGWNEDEPLVQGAGATRHHVAEVLAAAGMVIP